MKLLIYLIVFYVIASLSSCNKRLYYKNYNNMDSSYLQYEKKGTMASSLSKINKLNLTNEFTGHPYIYHVGGPHDNLWCYVIKQSDGLKLFWGDHRLSDNNGLGFDSLTISKCEILDWALDSLMYLVDSFKKETSVEIDLNRSYTIIVDSCGICRFEIDNSSTCDNKYLQYKYKELSSCLNYLSRPGLRFLYNIPDGFNDCDKLRNNLESN